MDIALPPASRSNPSLLMSAAALVLSAVALTNSLSPRGQGLARELPAEKRLSTSREYVTLEQLAIYQADGDAAKQLVSVGEYPRDESLDPAEHAALSSVCLAILNLDEALTRE